MGEEKERLMLGKRKRKKNQEWIEQARCAQSVQDIANVIEMMQFHRTFGLVDEQEVWDKLLILDKMYRRVFFIQEHKIQMLEKENNGAKDTI